MNQEKLAAMICRYLPGGDTRSRNLLPLYKDYRNMKEVVSCLAEPFRGKVDYVASPEPLGFILGSMLSMELGVGFIALRKYQMNPQDSKDLLVAPYINHRDEVTTLAVEHDMIPEKSRILLADDWIQTAATIQAGMTLIEEAGAELAGIAAIGADHDSAAAGMIDDGRIHCVYLK